MYQLKQKNFNPGYDATAFVATASVQMPSLPGVQFVMHLPTPGDFKKHMYPVTLQHFVLRQFSVVFEQES